ncbi:MAG: PH domain-containing protein [Prevotella sp.]|nr:PH domain-containing protein [Prevotella sp.]
MDRTFHYRISWLNIVSIIVVAAAMLYFLWHRSTACIIVGFILLFITLLMIERIIHTEYTLTSDGLLYIKRGRLSRTIIIRIEDIITFRLVKSNSLTLRFILIEYGVGQQIAVQPVNEPAFLEEIRKRHPKLQNRKTSK